MFLEDYRYAVSEPSAAFSLAILRDYDTLFGSHTCMTRAAESEIQKWLNIEEICTVTFMRYISSHFSAAVHRGTVFCYTPVRCHVVSSNLGMRNPI